MSVELAQAVSELTTTLKAESIAWRSLIERIFLQSGNAPMNQDALLDFLTEGTPVVPVQQSNIPQAPVPVQQTPGYQPTSPRPPGYQPTVHDLTNAPPGFVPTNDPRVQGQNPNTWQTPSEPSPI